MLVEKDHVGGEGSRLLTRIMWVEKDHAGCEWYAYTLGWRSPTDDCFSNPSRKAKFDASIYLDFVNMALNG